MIKWQNGAEEKHQNDPSDHHGVPGRSLGNGTSLPTLRKGFACHCQSSVLPPGPLPLHYPSLHLTCQSPNIGMYDSSRPSLTVHNNASWLYTAHCILIILKKEVYWQEVCCVPLASSDFIRKLCCHKPMASDVKVNHHLHSNTTTVTFTAFHQTRL